MCVYIYIYIHIHTYIHIYMKCCWKMPLTIHWAFPVKIHRKSDNPLEHTTDKQNCVRTCR